jgi:hypothetical protein
MLRETILNKEERALEILFFATNVHMNFKIKQNFIQQELSFSHNHWTQRGTKRQNNYAKWEIQEKKRKNHRTTRK